MDKASEAEAASDHAQMLEWSEAYTVKIENRNNTVSENAFQFCVGGVLVASPFSGNG